MVKSDLVSSPDLIRCVYHFQILKAICAGVGFGSGTETKSDLFQICRVARTQAALLRALGASVREYPVLIHLCVGFFPNHLQKQKSKLLKRRQKQLCLDCLRKNVM